MLRLGPDRNFFHTSPSTVYSLVPPQVARRKRVKTSSRAWPIPVDVQMFDVTDSGKSATWSNVLLWSLGGSNNTAKLWTIVSSHQ